MKNCYPKKGLEIYVIFINEIHFIVIMYLV